MVVSQQLPVDLLQRLELADECLVWRETLDLLGCLDGEKARLDELGRFRVQLDQMAEVLVFLDETAQLGFSFVSELRLPLVVSHEAVHLGGEEAHVLPEGVRLLERVGALLDHLGVAGDDGVVHSFELVNSVLQHSHFGPAALELSIQTGLVIHLSGPSHAFLLKHYGSRVLEA